MNLDQILQAAYQAWAPPPTQSVSEWAEEHFRLSPEYSAKSGLLKLYRYQREPVDAFGDPFVAGIVIMSATQMLKTLALQVGIAHKIAADPGPILLAQPTTTDGEEFSKERISPMIRDIESIRNLVAPEKKGSSSNSILQKVFKGGALSIIGAQTAGEFARRSICLFAGDEINKWPKNVGKEGSGRALGKKRLATFRSRGKFVFTCSPTIEGDCAISEEYEASDQRKFAVPCPHCSHLQILSWDRVKWENNDPLTALYHCAACNVGWTDLERWAACEDERAHWVVTNPDAPRNEYGQVVRGYWISELYSPWKSLAAPVADFLKAGNDPEALQSFVNTSLAETWREKGDAPKHEILQAHAQDYVLGTVPPGVRFLTAGVDVQGDRLEVAVWGWGRGRRRWLVDYTVIDGSPSNPATWDLLTEALNVSYPTEAGPDLPILRTAIDSGYEATKVYEWARRQGPGRVLVAKGYDSGAALLGSPSASEVTTRGKKAKYGVKVWPINVSMAKQELYGQIRLEIAEGATATPTGWVAIPQRGWIRPTQEEFCRQVVAEQYVTRIVKGYKRGEWVKVRERNEGLDTANLARAAAEHVGISRWGDRDWKRLDEQFRTESSVEVNEPEAAMEPKALKQINTRVPVVAPRPIVSSDPYL